MTIDEFSALLGRDPSGRPIPPVRHRDGIGINGRNFTPEEFEDITTRRDGESLRDHAHRIARSLRIGCVTSS